MICCNYNKSKLKNSLINQVKENPELFCVLISDFQGLFVYLFSMCFANHTVDSYLVLRKYLKLSCLKGKKSLRVIENV